MKTKQASVISEEMAIKETLDFYNHFSLKQIDWKEKKKDSDDEDSSIDIDSTNSLLEDNSIDMIKAAVMRGLLSFDENKVPTFKLSSPIKNEKGDISKSEIIFKTRLLPSDQRRLAKGMDLKKDTVGYSNKITMFIAGLASVHYLDKFSKFDYTVIQQMGTLFA